MFPSSSVSTHGSKETTAWLPRGRVGSVPHPTRALYLTALLTGMRRGELLALRWDDVDWTFGRVSVRHTLVRLKKQLFVREPKGARSRRTIALAPEVLNEFRRLKAAQEEAKQRFGSTYSAQGFVFCQRNGKPLHAHNVTQRDFREVAETAKLPRIRFHDVRHSHATLLLRMGTHPKLVQERLGHSQISTTLDTYSHVLPSMRDDVGHNLAALVSNG